MKRSDTRYFNVKYYFITRRNRTWCFPRNGIKRSTAAPRHIAAFSEETSVTIHPWKMTRNTIVIIVDGAGVQLRRVPEVVMTLNRKNEKKKKKETTTFCTQIVISRALRPYIIFNRASLYTEYSYTATYNYYSDVHAAEYYKNSLTRDIIRNAIKWVVFVVLYYTYPIRKMYRKA